MNIDWSWIAGHLGDMWLATTEHVTLTVIAVTFGFVIAMVLSVVALRWQASYGPITWFTGILYTIPSLAMFTFFIPFFGLSIVTAEIALVSYTLLILVRNIVAGIQGVPDPVIESARGMGMTDRELFLGVQLPLAVPVVIAGIRIATVSTIGLVTVTALIGQGGYGVFIQRGIRRQFLTEILVGTLLSVALALVADRLLARLEHRITPWERGRRVAE
jgi:osmoprotectant transport system permease protein